MIVMTLMFVSHVAIALDLLTRMTWYSMFLESTDMGSRGGTLLSRFSGTALLDASIGRRCGDPIEGGRFFGDRNHRLPQ
jgi:hypothetical protein